MDRVTIAGLEVQARHGVLATEREQGQRFVLDVVLDVDLSRAAATDDLADTVDYDALATRVAGAAAGGPYDLIETVAGKVADVCLADSRVQAATVTVRKPEAPVGVAVREVAVTLRRERGER